MKEDLILSVLKVIKTSKTNDIRTKSEMRKYSIDVTPYPYSFSFFLQIHYALVVE